MRLVLAPLAAVLFLAVLVPSAGAGTLTQGPRQYEPHPQRPDRYCDKYYGGCYESPQAYGGKVLYFKAEAGEANDISLDYGEYHGPNGWASWKVHDAGAPIEITPGVRCTHVGDDLHVVICDTDVLEFDLGDRDDRFEGMDSHLSPDTWDSPDWPQGNYPLEVDAGAGDDVLVAETAGWWGGGILAGGEGNDFIRANRAEGGPGEDRLEAFGYDRGRLGGGPGADTLTGEHASDLNFLCGDDTDPVYTYWYVREDWNGQWIDWRCAAGDDSSDVLLAGPGSPPGNRSEGFGDRLDGGGGADLLRGGLGFDELLGGAGDDDIYATGSRWHDIAYGGDGDDFVHSRNGRHDQVNGCGNGVDEWIRDPHDAVGWLESHEECENADPPIRHEERNYPPPPIAGQPAPDTEQPAPDAEQPPSDPWPLPPSAEPPATGPDLEVRSATLQRDGRLTMRLKCRADQHCKGKLTVTPTVVGAGRERGTAASRKYSVRPKALTDLRMKVPRTLRGSITSKRRANVALVNRGQTFAVSVRVRIAKRH